MKTNPVKILAASAAILAAASAAAKPLRATLSGAEPLKIKAERMFADNKTGTVTASGSVVAVSRPFRLESSSVEKAGDAYSFAGDTTVTTCTNESCSAHWSATGEVVFRQGRNVTVKNATLRLFGVPVGWAPYWYYPFDTNYGWRVMPGYTKNWGGYLLSKYVYPVAGSFAPGEYGLSGATRFDMRTKNGLAAGQSLDWQLGDFGKGKFKIYYAWDRDADTYDHHWSGTRRYRYENWGSTVPDERYAIMLRHAWNPTERDRVRIAGAYFSDSHFKSDFLRDAMFGHRNRFLGYEGNEIAWEHVENSFVGGVSVSGPLNDFYSGVSRLPEISIGVMPMPVMSLPATYESYMTIAWLDRDYAKYGKRTTAAPFRHNPGEWADYQTFRADSYHRFAVPFKIGDVVSAVPRVGFRGTWWNDSGRENLSGAGRAAAKSDGVFRSVVEGGVTFSARGEAQLGESWRHVVEPYADFLAQEAHYHGLGSGRRPLVFDSVDMSRDWLDQFAGRSRELPCSWYGVTPGVRNAFSHLGEDGAPKAKFDVDVYGAVRFNDASRTEGGRYHSLSKRAEDPYYGEHRVSIMPGFRTSADFGGDATLAARVEFDTERGVPAYASAFWKQKFSESFKTELRYTLRDHRVLDYSSSPYDPAQLKDEGFNRADFSYLDIGFEHDICDALAWGPFLRVDFAESGIEEAGAWFDIRTDCLGFRFSVAYEDDNERIDYSRSRDDWRFGFFIYLRALGPMSGSPFR